MAERAGWERRNFTAAMVGLGGAAAAVLGSYLPWIKGGDESFSGWDFYDMRSDLDENPFVIGEMFQDGFNPLFTGAVTLGFGLVLGALAVAVLAVRKEPPPAKRRVGAGLYAVIVTAGLLAFLVAATNCLTVFQRPSGTGASIQVGFWFTMLALFVAAGGVMRSASAFPADLREPAAAPVAAMPAMPRTPAEPAPDWYPDPVGRHEVRYWDGHVWTTHVADSGARSEDPAGVS